MPLTPKAATHFADSNTLADPEDASRVRIVSFLGDITAELANGPVNLPCFPDIVPRVRQALANPGSSADDIVRIAGSEPRLAARLLQTANSAVFNPGGLPLTNLRTAVTRLGHHLVQSVTLAFAVQQIKAEVALRPVAKQLGELWEKSIAVASICQVLARQLGVPADKVFLAGLLHGIGCFYILVRASSAADGIICDPVLIDFVEDWHPAIGQSVLEQWGFEPAMCEAVGNQHEYDRLSTFAPDLTDVLIASVALADALLEGNGDVSGFARITAFANLGLGPEQWHSTLRHTELSIASLRDALGC